MRDWEKYKNVISMKFTAGVPPEPEPCIVNVTGRSEAIIQSSNVEDKKKQAEKEGFALDCMWVIQVEDKWKVKYSFLF